MLIINVCFSTKTHILSDLVGKSAFIVPRKKSAFGTCNTPWPAWSVYKSDVECRFLSWNGQIDKPTFLEFLVKIAKMTLKIKVNHLHVQWKPRVSKDACLVQI